MTQAGQLVFSKMEEVVWGRPAAETVAALAQKRGAERVFLMVSGTLNRDNGRNRQAPSRAGQQMRRDVRPHAARIRRAAP